MIGGAAAAGTESSRKEARPQSIALIAAFQILRAATLLSLTAITWIAPGAGGDPTTRFEFLTY